MVELKAATRDLLQKFYGETQRKTVRAIVMVDGEEVLGVGGYYVQDSALVIFSEFKPEGFKHKKMIVRGTYELILAAHKTGLPIHCVPDPRIPTAERFLTQLGFEPLAEGVWEWQPPHIGS